MITDYQIGDILHFYNHVACKPKYHLLACLDPEPILLIINSEPSPFAQKNPKLLACHLEIKTADHSFLHHDSVVSCCEPCSGPEPGETIDLSGQLANHLFNDLYDAVSVSPTMSNRHKKMILVELDKLLS